MSNLTSRIIVGILGALFLVFVIIQGGIIALITFAIIQSLCLWEFYGLFKSNYQPHILLSVLLSLFTLLITHFYGIDNLIYVLILFFVFLIYEYIFNRKRNFINVLISFGGLLYITIPINLLNELEKNYMIVLTIFILIWASDTFSYFGGKLFGKRKLTKISPKKTVEGTIIGFIFTLITSIAIYYLTSFGFSFSSILIIGALVGVFSPVGDIIESKLKRINDVKDSSSILLGHGGVLDRFDSMIFVIPIVFVYINLFT